MPRMRSRDVRAIIFLLATSAAVFGMSWLGTHNLIAASALTAAYGVWLLTRPRMRRVLRRLRGETVDFTSYYQDF
jgi:hypothetical protein